MRTSAYLFMSRPDREGHRRVVRHGYLPEREVQTGIGPIAVRRPRVRDPEPTAAGGHIRFSSAILPPYLRRAKSLEELLPGRWRDSRGIGAFGSPQML